MSNMHTPRYIHTYIIYVMQHNFLYSKNGMYQNSKSVDTERNDYTYI